MEPSAELAHSEFQQGYALHLQGQLEQAQACYQRVLNLQPNHFDALHMLGNIALQGGDFLKAIALIDKAIVINPNFAAAYYNRGNAFRSLKKWNEALANYDQAILLDPENVKAFGGRGDVLQELNRWEEAVVSYEQALRIKPDYPFLYGVWLGTKTKCCDWNNINNQIDELSQKIARNEQASPPLCNVALIDSSALQRQAAQVWIKKIISETGQLVAIKKYPPHKKIRIGYFSADYHHHPTAYLMAELFEQHDKNTFEIYAFSFGPDCEDSIRERLRVAFDKFIDVREQSSREIAELARNMEIDIAVDLKGFTENQRLQIFAHRAAPVQVSYIGYPGTLGADFIDYLIADPTVVPEANQSDYVEKIVYLPNSYQVNDRKRDIADKIFSREELSLPSTGFVFCCFNNNYKILPDTFDSWMRILQQVPDSVLWLLEDNAAAANNLRKEAEKRGVSAQRLVFAKRISMAEHLARHRAADLFIDTLPYNAHTTASDALWTGLPVLTCMGQTFAGRVAASLLKAMDLPELITTTPEQFESLAVELALDPTKLGNIKRKLKENRLKSPLFDTPLFTRHIENAFLKMYKRHQADLPPEHIYVCADA